MIKIVNTEKVLHNEIVIKMCDMKPLQVGQIVKGHKHHVGLKQYVGHYVMRTASEGEIEVMDLTTPGPGACWMGPSTDAGNMVRLLRPDETITLEVRND